MSEARIRGCLLGGAIGDALGAAVEFKSLAEIRYTFGEHGLTSYAVAYGRRGAITDDTQLSLFTAEGLIRSYVRDHIGGAAHIPSIVQHAYLRWLNTQAEQPNVRLASEPLWPDGWLIQQRELWAMRAPGRTCLRSLLAITELGELPSNNSKGCGTVIRVAPVGLVLPPEQAFKVGLEVSRLTHGHPAGYLAGAYFAELIARIMRGRPLLLAISDALRPLRKHEGARDVIIAVQEAMRLAESGDPPCAELVESLGRGWVAEEALSIALYAALTARNFDEGLRLAVNHSGDSDSTGALCGNLLGAMWGDDAIARRWLAELELRRVIETIALDLLRVTTGEFDAEREWSRYPGW